MEAYNPKELLLFACNHFDLPVENHDGKIVHLEKGYTVEVEGQRLFKLLHDNQVVAPFDDVEELCHFIKQDIALNEES
ncbi:MAG: hypothetical protein AAF960_02730 [Bacteroidota bacterium]